jgi:hypothetical protein
VKANLVRMNVMSQNVVKAAAIHHAVTQIVVLLAVHQAAVNQNVMTLVL